MKQCRTRQIFKGARIPSEKQEIQRCNWRIQLLCARKSESNFLLCPHKPQLGSFIFHSSDGKDITVGCKACKLACVQGCSWAACEVKASSEHGFAKRVFEQHASTPEHQKAVVLLTGCLECKAALESKTSATNEEFEQVWSAKASGAVKDQTLKVKGRRIERNKKSKLEFLLAEGARNIRRAKLRKCDNIILHVDGATLKKERPNSNSPKICSANRGSY